MKRRIAIVCAAMVILIAVAFILYSPSDSWLDGTWTARDEEFAPQFIFNRNEFVTVGYEGYPPEPVFEYGTFRILDEELILTFSNGEVHTFSFSKNAEHNIITINQVWFTLE